MAETKLLAILFSDVCASTKIYDRLGDERGHQLVGHCVQLMADATHRHGGTVIKTIGDEVMASFPSADAAAAASVDMQLAISGRVNADGEGIAIRVGFCCAPVLVEEGDVFGDGVNLASRMASQARPGEILTPRATVERLSAAWVGNTRQVDRTRVKGKAAEIDCFEVVWEAEDVTRIKPTAWDAPPPNIASNLRLALGSQVIEVGGAHPTVTVGRALQNDLVADSELVSRLHARIEYRNGHFVLTDQSTNGSFVASDGEAVTRVHHDSLMLRGRGEIGLGEVPGAHSTTTVGYAVES